MLEVRDLTVRYGPLTIVDRVCFSVKAGEWLMLVGPNGAGKSTIVSAISQTTPYQGTVLLDEADAARKKPAELARQMGVLAQSHYVGYGFTVSEIVRLGRYAYRKGRLGTGGEGDDAAVERALEMTGMKRQERQSALTLSGGELQRTFLAQLFAQDPKLLILDEPTNHLDLVYQRQVFELIQKWLKEPGRAVISVVHDLSLALAYGTHALLLNGGKNIASGEIRSVLSKEHLQQVYQLDVYQHMKDLLSQWEEGKEESHEFSKIK